MRSRTVNPLVAGSSPAGGAKPEGPAIKLTLFYFFDIRIGIMDPLFAIREGEVMGTYKLTFMVTIEEQDDPAARKHAKGIIEALGGVVAGGEVKLQQMHQDKPPRGVRMG